MYQLAMARAKGGMSMERLTYDCYFGDIHWWHVKGAGNLGCRQVCEEQEENGCKGCPIELAFDRLAAYEDTGLAPEEVQQMRWIPVEERLPEEKQRVIVRCERVGTSVGWILWGNWMTDIGPGAGKVTHWMPLPQPPKEASHD